jgi:hypothetical protein
MATTIFTHYSDPSHGWLLVPTRSLGAIGLTTASFSRYSYRGPGGVLALEEDCDAGVFVDAWKAKNGVRPTIIDETTNADAPMRSWRPL